jgi:Tol biopolymer transport system component
VAGGLTAWRLLPAPAVPTPAVTRFAIPASASVAPGGAGTGRHVLALSPLGTHLVYWGDNQLVLRALDRLEEGVPLRGTEEAREPFFSPDGQWIGFHQEGQLKRVSVNGGVPVVVGEARNPWGISWDSDGMLRYGQGPDGIWQMPVAGGKSSQLVSVDTGAMAHGPQLLPDGEWLLYTLRPAGVNSWDQSQIVVQSLRSGERVVLVESGRDARYVSTGHLLYGLNGTLLAVPFDVRQRRVRGAAVPLVEGVLDADFRTGALQFSVSDIGSLVYLTGASGLRRTLMWAGQDGRTEPLTDEAQFYDAPRISPDGTHVTVSVVNGPDGGVVRVYDLTRKSWTQFTSPGLQSRSPLWSRDGRRVIFYSESNGGGLFSQAVDGTGAPERLTTTQAVQLPYSWSADGRTLLIEQKGNDRTSPADIYALALDGTAKPVSVVATPMDEFEPALSPDGKWLAYTALDSNRNPGVFVRPFPDVDLGRWQISTDSGYSPLWAPDGKRLFYISRAQVFGVSIATEPAFEPGLPKRLFDLPPFYSARAVLTSRQWDIAPDGRFLIVNPGAVTTAGDPTRMQMVVVTNWFEELKRLVPAPRQ